VVTRGWIGVQIQPVTQDIADSLGLKEAHGALVAEAQANSPAAKAGVESGDVVVAVNGAEVKDARDLAKKIGALAPNETVKLGILRKGNEKTVSVTLGTFPNEKQARAETNGRQSDNDSGVPQLGLSLAPASAVAGADANGVVVTGVDPNGPAAERGFKSGDVITEVAGKTVERPSDVRNAIDVARKDGKRTILMRVKTGDATRFVALPVGHA
jgi:serine protease Do